MQIKFGTAIRAFIMSEKHQTVSSVQTAPTNVARVYAKRYAAHSFGLWTRYSKARSPWYSHAIIVAKAKRVIPE